MKETFKFFLIGFLIIFFIYLAISGYFVYKYVRNTNKEDEIYYFNKIKTFVIIGIFIVIISVTTLVSIYFLENRSNENKALFTKSSLLMKDFPMRPPLLIGTTYGEVLDNFTKMYNDLRNRQFSNALNESLRIKELIVKYDLSELLYLRDILQERKVINNLKVLGNKYYEKPYNLIGKSILELCYSFEYTPETILLSIDKLNSVLKDV